MDKEPHISEAFVIDLTQFQNELYTYVLALTGAANDAQDILQDANVYIWKNAANYNPERPFLPWAKAMVRAQVQKHRLYRAREVQHVVFDQDVFEAISATLAEEKREEPVRLEALRKCLSMLTDEERRYLELKYVRKTRISELVRIFHSTEAAVTSKLYRIRTTLNDCVVRAICRLNRN